MSIGIERDMNELVIRVGVRDAQQLKSLLESIDKPEGSVESELYLAIASQNLEYEPGYGVSDYIGDVQPRGVDGICADAGN